MLRILSRVFTQSKILRSMLLVITIIFVALFVSSVYSQEYKEPEAADIAQKKDEMTKAISDASVLAKDKKFLEQLHSNRKQIQSIDQTAPNSGFEIPQYFDEERNKRYLQSALGANAEIQTVKTQDVLSPMVLVSFSMPESQLKGLLIEASGMGAAVVLSGLYQDDFEKTVRKIGEIAGREDLGIAIDPTLFTRFEVSAVPFFIMPMEPVKSCTESGCDKPKAVTAKGSATLQYFLETVSRVGTKEEQKVAESWLAKGGKE